MLKTEDNSQLDELSEEDCQTFLPYADVPLIELVSNHKDLLVFPHSLGGYQDGIDDQTLYSFHGTSLCTGNVVGFIGVNNKNLQIHSRFDHEEKQFFLHFLLQKIFCGTLLNLPTGIGIDRIWDFLVYLFPYYLQKALIKGVFKTYRSFHYNESHAKGAIDFATHIRKNIPFQGRIAVSTRDFTQNNHLTHLIRHTIETVKRNPLGKQLLSLNKTVRDAVSTIEQATPDYNPQDLRRTVAMNLRPIKHPYFSEYTCLQKLCLEILRHERITYGDETKKIYGIVFDIAWLWEEYLATLLSKIDFTHSHNKTGDQGIKLYTDGYPIFPDYYCLRKSVIIDAKYKRLDNKKRTNALRDDRFQLISYMHITKATKGFLLHPTMSKQNKLQFEGCLCGHGGTVGIYGLAIPQADNFNEFSQEILKNEQDMLRELKVVIDDVNP